VLVVQQLGQPGVGVPDALLHAGLVQIQEAAGRTRWAPVSLFAAASAMEDEQWNSKKPD